MRILINNLYRPELEQDSFQLSQQASDPVPTCSFTLKDEDSSIPISSFQEVIVIDETAYGQPPTHNFLQVSDLNPYHSADAWSTISNSGITLSQFGGGGMVATFSNAATGNTPMLSQIVPDFSLSVPIPYIQPHQAYTFACTAIGTPTNVKAVVGMQFLDATSTPIGSIIYGTALTPTGGGGRIISVTATSPAKAFAVTCYIACDPTSGTNSGTITYVEAQLEANWYPTVSYPTQWIGDGTASHEYILPDGTSIREKRMFAGWITDHKFKPVGGGPVADWSISCSAYGWLFDKRTNNSTFTAIRDDTMINGIVLQYFFGRFTSNHVVAAPITISNLQYSFDTLRKMMDDICTLTNQRWFVDPYGDVWYVPQQYAQAGYGLVDSNPDNVSTFTYSNYEHEYDFTQPTNSTTIKINAPSVNTTSATTIAVGANTVTPASMSSITSGSQLVFSGGTGVTETITVSSVTATTFNATFAATHSGSYSIASPSTPNAVGMARIEQGQARAIYGAVFEKYIDDSQIIDQATAHARGIAENLQNAYAREIIHLELDEQASQSQIQPGVSIQITSTNEGIIARSYLIQNVAISILASGDNTLRTRYKYAVDLGDYNPNLENLIIKNFVQTSSSSTILPNPTAQWNMADEMMSYIETETHTP